MGHIFKSTQYSIPTYCEFCSSLIWMMDKACVCKRESCLIVCTFQSGKVLTRNIGIAQNGTRARVFSYLHFDTFQSSWSGVSISFLVFWSQSLSVCPLVWEQRNQIFSCKFIHFFWTWSIMASCVSVSYFCWSEKEMVLRSTQCLFLCLLQSVAMRATRSAVWGWLPNAVRR